MTGPVLAGRTPGVALDDRGMGQAQGLAQRLADLPLAAVVSSPLERCEQTAAAITASRDGQSVIIDERLVECGYGEWTGQELKKLAKDPLWKVVQAHPSAAVFPSGEALRDVQARAVGAVRDWNARLGPDAIWVACSHGDVIKSIVADALGMHLDLFQRLVIDPCSVTVIRYTDLRPFVERLNDNSGSLGNLKPKRKRRSATPRATSDAVVGGGSGL
jgi:probable phosphoglycerate mutase